MARTHDCGCAAATSPVGRARARRPSARSPKLAKKGRARLAGARSRAARSRSTFWGKALVRQPRALQRLREPPAARAHLRAQRLGGRPADRAGRGRGAWSAARSSTRSRSKVAAAAEGALEPRLRATARGRSTRSSSCCRGDLSTGVMERVCRPEDGAVPRARARSSSRCTCPDWAAMCKHVAAVLYGVGARLDDQPELLFGCARSTRSSSSRRPGRACRSGRRRCPPGACWRARRSRRCSGSTSPGRGPRSGGGRSGGRGAR